MSLYVEIGAPHDAAFDVDALRERVLADLRREAIVTDHQLVAHHHVVLDPAYVHITQASLAETTRIKAVLAGHGVHSVAATAAGPTARSRTTSSRPARSRSGCDAQQLAFKQRRLTS